jgi:tetratricopeptide (TPR) repeat protein
MMTTLPSADCEPVTTNGTIAVANLHAQIAGLAARARPAPPGQAAAPLAVAAGALMVDLLTLRGEVLGRIADYEEAAELAEDLVRDAPDDGTAWLARARIRATFHRFTEALSDLETARRSGLDRATMDAERAPILQAVGCYWHALVLCDDAAKRRPGFTTLGALAVLQAERGEVAAAERLFAEARRCYQDISPFPIASLDYRRGLMWLGEGDLPAARSWFSAAQRRVPAYAPAVRHLAEADAALGAHEAAIGRPACGATRRPRATPNWSCATRGPSPTTRPTSGQTQPGRHPGSRTPADHLRDRKEPEPCSPPG